MISRTFIIGNGIILTVRFYSMKNYREFLQITELEPEQTRYERRHEGEHKK